MAYWTPGYTPTTPTVCNTNTAEATATPTTEVTVQSTANVPTATSNTKSTGTYTPTAPRTPSCSDSAVATTPTATSNVSTVATTNAPQGVSGTASVSVTTAAPVETIDVTSTLTPEQLYLKADKIANLIIDNINKLVNATKASLNEWARNLASDMTGKTFMNKGHKDATASYKTIYIDPNGNKGTAFLPINYTSKYYNYSANLELTDARYIYNEEKECAEFVEGSCTFSKLPPVPDYYMLLNEIYSQLEAEQRSDFGC